MIGAVVFSITRVVVNEYTQLNVNADALAWFYLTHDVARVI